MHPQTVKKRASTFNLQPPPPYRPYPPALWSQVSFFTQPYQTSYFGLKFWSMEIKPDKLVEVDLFIDINILNYTTLLKKLY